MNRAFFIVGIVFSVIFMFITSYYADEVQSARWDAWDYSYSNYSYDSYDSYSYPTYSSYSYDYSDGLTTEAGLWSLFFFLCFCCLRVFVLFLCSVAVCLLLFCYSCSSFLMFCYFVSPLCTLVFLCYYWIFV